MVLPVPLLLIPLAVVLLPPFTFPLTTSALLFPKDTPEADAAEPPVIEPLIVDVSNDAILPRAKHGVVPAMTLQLKVLPLVLEVNEPPVVPPLRCVVRIDAQVIVATLIVTAQPSA